MCNHRKFAAHILVAVHAEGLDLIDGLEVILGLAIGLDGLLDLLADRVEKLCHFCYFGALFRWC